MGRWAGSAAWCRRVLFSCLVGVLTACGGGGSDGDGRPVTATFNPPLLEVGTIEGMPVTATFSATIDSGGRDSLYIGIEEAQGLVIDGSLSITPPSIFATLQMSSTLAPGVYDSAVRVLACADVQCRQQLPGSPMQLPLRYTVNPQIKIQAPDTVRRTGREPAPTLTLPVVLPPLAGDISVELINDRNAFGPATLQGNQLVVQTRQVPAGFYNGRVRLTGSADSRYQAAVDLRYEVSPPPEGERPLSVSPTRFDLRLAQGAQNTYRFKVERPTWSDAPVSVTISPFNPNVVRDLRPLGNDEYEFTVDTRNVPLSPSSGEAVVFGGFVVEAGEFGGQTNVQVVVTVGAPLSFSDPSAFQMAINATTNTADLERRTGVTATDGSAVRWTASANQPWVELVRSSGTTGVDALEYRINPSVLLLDGLQQFATLSVALDRPGTLPVEVPISVRNVVPRFDMASPGVLTGSSAKVYVHGLVMRESEVLRIGVLSVEGATLRSASIEEDTRFTGSVALLALTLSDIVPGRPVTIRAASPLRPAAVTLPSTGPVRVPAGYAALPYAPYRPPSFASNAGALVFAGPGTVWRWALGSPGGWQTPRAQDVAGAIDAAYAPDESYVLVTAPGTVMALDPSTLQTRRQGLLQDMFGRRFDGRAEGFVNTLAFAADGRAFASVQPAAGLTSAAHAVSWLAGCADLFLADPTRSTCLADPSNNGFIDESSSPSGASIARSQEGNTLTFSHPGGQLQAYRGHTRDRELLDPLPPGRRLVALDNNAIVTVRDDGLLDDGIFQSFVAARLPAGFVAGGYAVRGDGDLVAVYAYRIVNEPAGLRARDARLILFGTPGRSGAGLSGQVDLPDAVGCTAPLVAGETCGHTAALQFAPGGQSLFLLGPRGVAAVPVPTLSASATPASRSPFRKIAPTKQPAAR